MGWGHCRMGAAMGRSKAPGRCPGWRCWEVLGLLWWRGGCEQPHGVRDAVLGAAGAVQHLRLREAWAQPRAAASLELLSSSKWEAEGRP